LFFSFFLNPIKRNFTQLKRLRVCRKESSLTHGPTEGIANEMFCWHVFTMKSVDEQSSVPMDSADDDHTTQDTTLWFFFFSSFSFWSTSSEIIRFNPQSSRPALNNVRNGTRDVLVAARQQ
jgi:hypothetical protein